MKKKVSILFGVILALVFAFALTACGKVSLKLTFKVDGVDYATISTSGDEVIKMPENPTKDGFVFDGWFWDEGTWQKPFTANSLLDTPLSSDMSVYAKFTANADAPPTGTEIRSNLFTQNGEVYSTVVPNRDSAFSFNDKIQVADGATWALYDNIRCVNEIISRATEIEAGDNIFYVLVINGNERRQYTFNVRRRPIYTVNFKSDGPHIASQQVEEGNLATEPVGVARDGYEFDGWSYDFSQPIISHTEIGVRWKAIDYDISYSLDGGEFKTDYAGKYTIENEIKLATPEKRGYDFAGWYETGKTTPTAKIAKGTFGNKAFTAKWNAHAYDINYVLGSGTNSSNNPTKYTIESADITLSEPFYINADFNGWKCTINGKDAPNGAESGVIPKGTVGDIKFTAMWNEFEVKLEDVSDGYAVVGRNIEKSEIVIAPSYHGKNVTEIKDRAFYNCSDLTSITIGCNVTSIGSYAFNGCSSLTSVKIPNKVETIGAGAFGGCNGLIDIEFGENVTSIGDFAFEECVGLTSVAIPNKVAVIGESAFGGCIELKEVSIPDSLTSIGENAFGDCPIETAKMPTLAIPCVAGAELKTVEITSGDSIAAGAFNGCNLLESIALPFVGGSHSATNGASVFGFIFGYKTTTDSSMKFADAVYQYEGYDISLRTTYYYHYFIPKSLKTVKISGTEIGSRAFYNCADLTSIAISDSVTSIGIDAFYNCSSLTSITIPNSVTSIDSSAFNDCNNLASIEVNEDNNVYKSIDGNLYMKDDKKFVLYAKGKKETKFTITDGVTKIEDRAFSDCGSLMNITIPDSVTSIGSYAFSNSGSLTSVEIGNGVTSIGSSAFSGCIGLTNITIPDSVSSVGSSAFYNCSSLTNVYISELKAWLNIDFYNKSSNPLYYAGKLYLNDNLITELVVPDDITKIGSNAFFGCTSLTSVTIPNSVTSIEDSAFDSCSSLANVMILDSVMSIGEYAFFNCSSLTSVSLGNSVMSIGEYAFYKCSNLTSVTIPDSVTSIGSYAFYGCNRLESIILPFVGETLNSTGYRGVFGYIFGYIRVESYSTKFDNAVYQYISYGSDLTPTSHYYHYYIPKSLKTVKINGGTFWSSAFRNCSGLTSVTISDSVTSIGEYTFSGCTGLTSITIPDKVTSIGKSAFSGCTGLTSITIPDKVTSIGKSAFSGCTGLTSITIPDKVTSIGESAFSVCTGLTSITIPDKVTSIGKSAFYGCNRLESIELPFVGGAPTAADEKSVFGFIFGYTITDSSLTESADAVYQYYYYDSLLDRTAYYYHYYIPKSLKTVKINGGSIGSNAFYNCSNLTSITIPNNVTSIGDSAFEYCSNLTSITIPNSVTSIGDDAFEYCYRLAEVYNLSKLNIVKNTTNNGYIGYYALDIYTDINTPSKLSEDNNGFVIHTADSGEKILIGYFGSKTSITIPDSVTGIGDYAFYDCSSLTNVTIPNRVTSIGDYAFYDCSSLMSVTIGNSVTSIGNNAFFGCSSLTSITIPDSVTSIGNNAFFGCSSLTSITIPDSVTSIGNSAFYNCSSLTSITVDENNINYKSIDGNLYTKDGTTLIQYAIGKKETSFMIPNSVTSIRNSAFSGCSNLTSITISNSVTSIENYAFYGCSKLTTVYYKGSVQDWAKISIGFSNDNLMFATRYYYSESKPTSSGNYWHYVNGVPTVWK